MTSLRNASRTPSATPRTRSTPPSRTTRRSRSTPTRAGVPRENTIVRPSQQRRHRSQVCRLLPRPTPHRPRDVRPERFLREFIRERALILSPVEPQRLAPRSNDARVVFGTLPSPSTRDRGRRDARLPTERAPRRARLPTERAATRAETSSASPSIDRRSRRRARSPSSRVVRCRRRCGGSATTRRCARARERSVSIGAVARAVEARTVARSRARALARRRAADVELLPWARELDARDDDFRRDENARATTSARAATLFGTKIFAWVYWRGYEQMFNALGYPGVEKEVELAARFPTERRRRSTCRAGRASLLTRWRGLKVSKCSRDRL